MNQLTPSARNYGSYGSYGNYGNIFLAGMTNQTRESEISRMELKVVVHLSGQELLFSGLSGLKGPFHWL